MGLIMVFGMAMPAPAPLLINSIDARADVLVPAQTWFGPFAFLGYLWLRRHYGRERTMREFLASNDIVRTPGGRAPPPGVRTGHGGAGRRELAPARRFAGN